MRAAQLSAPGEIRLVTLPDHSPPGPGEALLAVTAVGICGSDLHAYRAGTGGDVPFGGRVVLGHEFAGRVLAVGPNARDGNGHPLLPGRRVAVDPAQSCGVCAMCRRGEENLCTAIRFCGLHPDDGSLREQMVVPAGRLFPLPDEIDDDSGVLLEPLGVALHAVRLARVSPGERVLCIGAGPIGLCIIQSARIAGAGKVLVSENLPWRLDAAARLGAEPVRGSTEERSSKILRETESLGVDAVFEAAWGGEAIQEALDLVRPGGRVILVGIPEHDRFDGRHSVPRRKGVTLIFVRRMLRTYPRAIELVRSGRIDLRGMVSHRFGLAEAAEAFRMNAAYAPGVMKVILHPDR